MDTAEIATALLDYGACLDCGCPVTNAEEAQAHAASDEACDAWNEGPGRNRMTIFRPDGTFILAMINESDEVDDIASALRTVLEGIQAERDERGLRWTSNLTGACDVGSAALVRLLRRRGIQATFVMGEYAGSAQGALHCWVTLADGSLVDVTATQFNIEPTSVAVAVASKVEVRVRPPVYRAPADKDYKPWWTGRKAARETRDWEDVDREALIALAVRRTERALAG